MTEPADVPTLELRTIPPHERHSRIFRARGEREDVSKRVKQRSI